MGIDFDINVPEINIDEKSAEKYIVSLKLQKYIEKLQNEKKDLTSRLLSGEDVKNQIKQIDEKLIDAQEKMETLMSI